MTPKPVIVLVTTHAAYGAMLERHAENFATMAVYSSFDEFERNALRISPKALIIDEERVSVAMKDMKKFRRHPTFKKLPIILLCAKATPEHVTEFHEAGYDDIILTTHHTPRAIMARIHNLFL